MENEAFRTVAREAEAEIEEKRSVFIAAVRRVETEEEALAFVKERKKRYPDATHTVYAYLLRKGAARYSDDSEPTGTAGMPTLEAIRRAGLSDVVPNRTVSLSNDTALRYHKQDVAGTYVNSTTLIPFEGIQTQSTPSLLLQFSGTWERLQAEPFFSNTFARVTYQTDFVDDPAVFSAAAPRVVVQFLYEDQLSWLVPHIAA